MNDRVRDVNTMKFLTEMINERIPRTLDELDEYLTKNEIVTARSVGVGYISAEDAINLQCCRPPATR